MISGTDLLTSDPHKYLKGKNFVLITGSSNCNSEGEPVYLSLKRKIPERFKAVWSLQHGFTTDMQDNMILSPSYYSEELGMEIKSLYSENLVPESSATEGIDAVVVDIFDVGTRVYTFTNHVLMILQSLPEHVEIIIPDRINCLGRKSAEGNVSEEKFFSIVSMLPLPMRHGLTAAEFMNYGRYYYKIKNKFTIIKVSGWNGEIDNELLWTYPSPNMPSLRTAAVYPGAVMLEGTNISEGRGTTRPFELAGAPWIDNKKLCSELKRCGIPDYRFIPVNFKPEFSKFKNSVCNGILADIGIAGSEHSFRAFYELIRLTRSMWPEYFEWKEPPYEFEYRRKPIDMICGSDFIRKSVENNLPYESIAETIEGEIAQFRQNVEDFILY